MFAKLALLSLALVSAKPVAKRWTGCGTDLPSGQTPGSVNNITVQSNGLTRSYLVFVPPNYSQDCPTPLILSYHGGENTDYDQLQLDNLTSPYFNNDSFVVYPQGINNTWQGVPGVTTNDLLFTSDIINAVQSQYCIDPLRISATGKSDGAGFCNVLACDRDLSSRIAAFAPVSGAYYVKNTSICDPDTILIPCSPSRHNIPMLAFHGGADPVIAYAGGPRKGQCLPSIPNFIRQWAARDYLPPQNTTVPLAEDTVVYEFGNLLEPRLVDLVYDSVNKHDWPSTQPNLDNVHAGNTVASFNATPIILDFFREHPLIGW